MAFELDLRKIHLGQSGIASFATKPQAIQIARLAVPRCDALDSLPDDEDPIPGDDPIIAYAEQAGIRHDWLVLCWNRQPHAVERLAGLA